MARIKKKGDNIKYTTKEYYKLLKQKDPDVKCLEEYVNRWTKINHTCKVHGVFLKSPYCY